MNTHKPVLPGFGWLHSFVLFGTAGLLLWLGTHFLIPYLSGVSGMETVIWWFIVAAFGIFIPMLIISYFILKSEGRHGKPGVWKERLRFRRMNFGDWAWGIGGIVVIGLCSYIVMVILARVAGPVDHQPPFMKFEPLTRGRYWVLGVWFVYWIFNIMGEEVLWRGVVLPRQEISFGKYAWVMHGSCWGVFHVAFGWQLLITLLPIIFIQSFIVQKRKNSWIGVLIHAGINGPGFIAISLGLL